MSKILDYFHYLLTDPRTFKSNKAVSLSEGFALFNWKTRQFIQYRTTAILRRHSIKQYTASIESGGRLGILFLIWDGTYGPRHNQFERGRQPIKAKPRLIKGGAFKRLKERNGSSMQGNHLLEPYCTILTSVFSLHFVYGGDLMYLIGYISGFSVPFLDMTALG